MLGLLLRVYCGGRRGPSEGRRKFAKSDTLIPDSAATLSGHRVYESGRRLTGLDNPTIDCRSPAQVHSAVLDAGLDRRNATTTHHHDLSL